MEPAEAREDRIDAVELIQSDHRLIEGLFTRYEDASTGSDDGTREQLVLDITRELSRHAGAEEQIFYPAVRQVLADGEPVVEESLDDHQHIKELLASLGDASPSDDGYDALVRELMSEVREHVAEEESDILPRLSTAVGPDEMRRIGEQMVKAKVMAPTRPHPNAPNTPPGNLVAGPAAGVVDRLRDAARGDG